MMVMEEDKKEVKRQRTEDEGSSFLTQQVRAATSATHEEDEEKENIDGSEDEEKVEEEDPASVIVQFCDLEGSNTGPNIDIPIDSTPEQMEELINQLVQNESYSFYLGESEIMESLSKSISEKELSTEAVLKVTYQPLAVFRVRPVS
eukprot:CAMPEP_0117890648 /NCGR_PEP_ID=MMETSP0950-20121206/23442_1 /TAXON_ID=44440 /ORGANISM="Chattonella subsalsa, Strain CCMP2191" /LENGTH=146 /DNA_ID=CAMNT_0005749929 /DNA_START=54 /DNA_END=490 /DNA_ORIENTATION=-